MKAGDDKNRKPFEPNRMDVAVAVAERGEVAIPEVDLHHLLLSLFVDFASSSLRC